VATVSETGAVGGKKITIEQFFAIEKQLKEKFEKGEIDRDEFNDSYDRLKCLYEKSENSAEVGSTASSESTKGGSDATKGTSKINLNQKPNVTNEKLKNIINDLYKGQGGPNTIGNGTTMDAVRNEIKTGLPTNGKFHTQKLNDYLNALQRRLRAGDLNDYDKSVVNTLIEDITNALNGK